MKKLVYMAAICAAFAFASCGGNKTSDAAPAADSTAATGESGVEIATNIAESAVTDLDAALSADKVEADKVKEITANIQKTVKQLEEAGKTEEAAAYASKVKAYLEKNADKIKSVDASSLTVLDVVNAAANLPQSVKDAANEGVDAVKADGSAAKAAATAATEAAKEAGKAAANQAVESAKAKANEEANKAVEKANKKADEAVQKGAQKASDAISKGLNSLGKK